MNFSRFLWLLAATITAWGGDLSAATATQLSQYGITWFFAKPVEYGTFVNGDYYVVDPGGGVQISSVTPVPADGRNGSMVNPVPFPNWGVVKNQGYDNRIAYYNASAALAFPAVLTAGKSLVSTVSLQPSDLNSTGTSYTASWQTKVKPATAHIALKSAAVLTVLAKHPPAGSFRPPFVGSVKPLYNVSQIQTKYLPKLTAPATAPTGTVAYFERGLERPWLLHGYDWEARLMHPLENMHNYHQNVGEFLSEASLVMLTKLCTETLRNRYIQSGIDAYHTVILGVADSAFFEWQAIYTGMLLGDSAMANVIRTSSITQGRASEKFYFWADRTTTIPPSEGVTPGRTWSGATVFFRKQYGVGEHEHLHPSQWGLATTSTNPLEGGKKSESYRQANDSVPHLGMFLSSRILGGQGYWKNTANDAYLERWMTEDWAPYSAIINQYWSGVPNYTRNMGSQFMNEMWSLYRNYKLGDSEPVTPPGVQAATPAASVAEGVYQNGVSVALTSTTPNAAIYYTLDGSLPGTASTRYSAPISIQSTKTLRAVATAEGFATSNELLRYYVIDTASTMLSSLSEWKNLRYNTAVPEGYSPHADQFTLKFLLTPLADSMDGVLGLADGAVDASGGYSKLATTVRFNTGGTIDARDAATYKADRTLAYQKGVSYQVEMRVDFKAKTYDVLVDGTAIATGYKFRTGQETVGKLDHVSIYSSLDGKPFTARILTKQAITPNKPVPGAP